MIDKSVFPIDHFDETRARDLRVVDGPVDDSDNMFEQPGVELPSSYEGHIALQSNIEQMREEAGLDVLKLPIHRKFARLVIGGQDKPTQKELINREAEVAACIIPESTADPYHHYFWFENGSWYFADYDDEQHSWIAEFKISEHTVTKLYKGVPQELSAQEQQTFLNFVERYHETIKTQVYHAA